MSEPNSYLHTMLRVGNLERSVKFYTEAFGMKELRRRDVPEGQYTLVFLGYGENPLHTQLELTYNYSVESYEIGTGFGHLAIGLPDVYATCEHLRAAGAKITHVDAKLRFVVIDYRARAMPAVGTRVTVYRAGQRVGEVQITDPVRVSFATADIRDGEVRVGDEAR